MQPYVRIQLLKIVTTLLLCAFVLITSERAYAHGPCFVPRELILHGVTLGMTIVWCLVLLVSIADHFKHGRY